ncbi:MAG: hypothetical protein COX62_08655 [Deltaproteobacteria bacterium CG_4_10_14_0_2_um_filter_43_8]|nr:MAG: hypothetical protein COV43_08785 [Deltaproteobacteria bacterium CG11_big_fil_rev_8_21_14_0_20_42_23]PJA18435.1 MAG: hypothetical protein COX62_08655 [Deltaproteobacteria bacterium CG_4_10_14_0_2_um_filter_43_8]PJC64915.1 MAG: hypothetical protein CO021_01670 [Deltaproteobacteria bacterium CG_4_9_14_0_2_um_filter_42_21]
MADFKYELLKGVPFLTAIITGKHLQFSGRFIVDTGAAMTIIRTPRIDALGYSANEALRVFNVESVIGKEKGYTIRIKKFEIFNKYFDDFEVAALDLPSHYHIDGLIGMNVLGQFDWCMHPKEDIISLR